VANDVNESNPAARTEAPAWRLITTLAAAGGLAGLALVLVYPIPGSALTRPKPSGSRFTRCSTIRRGTRRCTCSTVI
jgi:hypothetical protein